MTNGDRIRSLTDRNLAYWMRGFVKKHFDYFGKKSTRLIQITLKMQSNGCSRRKISILRECTERIVNKKAIPYRSL